jgi:hypothetical protein
MNHFKGDAVDVELITDLADPSRLAGQLLSSTLILERGSFDEIEASRLEALVAERLEHILTLAAPYDAFDVVELVRMAQSPLSLDGHRESENATTPATVELVVILLLVRGSRQPTRAPGPQETRPAGIVDEVFACATDVLNAVAYQVAGETAQITHPLAALTAQYRSTELRVRVRQYPSIQADVERALFQEPSIDSRLQEAIGFGYDDVVHVRHAVRHLWGASRTGLLEGLQNLLEPHVDVEAFLEEALGEVIDAFLEHPGASSTVTEKAVADRSGLGEEACQRVIVELSLPFVKTDPVKAAWRFLRGDRLATASTLEAGASCPLGARLHPTKRGALRARTGGGPRSRRRLTLFAPSSGAALM